MESSSLGSRVLLLVALSTAPTIPVGVALRRPVLPGGVWDALLEILVCGVPALVCAALVVAGLVRWLARRPGRFDAGVGDGLARTVACAPVGLACGWYAGSLHAWDALGPHTAAVGAYFGPLLLALAACASRAPAWMAAVDATLLTVGVELGAQSGNWWSAGRVRYWDDITVTDVAFLACTFVAIALFAAARTYRPGWAERLRRPERPPLGPDGVPLPRRAP